MSLGLLAICIGVLTAASIARVSPERAHVGGIEGPSCLVRGIFGDEACPGCGLTRSTAFVLQGQWGSAWAIHPGGFVIALLCGVGIPLHFADWRHARRRRHAPADPGSGTKARDSNRSASRIRWSGLTRWAILVGVVAPWLWRAWLSR